MLEKMIYNRGKYKPTDKMSDLICDNYNSLQVLSRFELPLGFGDQTVQEVCDSFHVDWNTFLAVVNFISEENNRVADDFEGLSVVSLMNYLKQAHHYFLEFQLPSIRSKLNEAIQPAAGDKVAVLIMKYFDSYTEEVRKHMDYEDKHVFRYVEKLLTGERSNGFHITQYARRHDQVEQKLKELKNIIIKYYPANVNNNLLNSVLFDIFCCEDDLISHCEIEDYLFVPIVRRLEEEEK